MNAAPTSWLNYCIYSMKFLKVHNFQTSPILSAPQLSLDVLRSKAKARPKSPAPSGPTWPAPPLAYIPAPQWQPENTGLRRGSAFSEGDPGVI